jgi:histidinol-phosphate phosphatase family protein
MLTALKKAIFLDIEGTFVSDVPFPIEPARMQLAAGAASGLPLLHASGYRLIFVSNQPGIARGWFPETALQAMQARIRALLDTNGAQVAAFYHCPHDARGTVARYAFACACRKPRAGMLQRAASEQHLDLGASWLVGNRLDDIEAGHSAGAHAVLIDDGAELAWDASGARRPDAIADDFAEAAMIIASSARGSIHA